MKILILTASLPYPPHQGGALRTYGILHGLHQAGHEITLLSFHDAETGVAIETTPLAHYCKRIKTVKPPYRSKAKRLRDLILTNQPDIARRLYSDDFFNHLHQLATETQFDIIQAEGIEVACYLPLIQAKNIPSKLCYDAFNAEAALQQVIFQIDRREIRRWPAAAYSLIQSSRIARFEHELLQLADLVIAVSAEDATILRQYRPERVVSVVANGIFTSEYHNSSEQLDLGEHALVFTGKMDYRPNVDAMFWFAEQVLPLIYTQIPDARLYIVGQKPHPRLEKLRDQKGIEITGWVQDVKPFLRGAGVYVAPLRMGSGTRLKILEAMAAGCAVIATTIAASGMRDDSQEAMLIVDNPSVMAAHIVTLLRDSTKRQQMGNRAQQYVKTNYDWSVLIPSLLQAYEGLKIG